MKVINRTQNMNTCRCATCGRKARVYNNNSYGLYGCKYHLLIYFKFNGDNVETVLDDAINKWERLNNRRF